MSIARSVDRLLRDYPRIYFACHQRHRRDPATQRQLSAQQASVLDHLDALHPTSVTDLADHLGVTPSTMSLMLDRLQRGGYVRRTRAEDDRRRVEVRLTEAGVRMKEAASVLDPDLVASLLRALSPLERARALDGLSLLAAAAGRMASGGRGRGPRAAGRSG